MVHRDNIREISRIATCMGITGILYCAYSNNHAIKTNPTPLLETYNKHASRIRVLEGKKYLEHLTTEQEKSQINQHTLAMQIIEKDPQYPQQKILRQYVNSEIAHNKNLFYTSIGLLAIAGLGYYSTRPRKPKIEVPYKLEIPSTS
jgi:hypothetical protein